MHAPSPPTNYKNVRAAAGLFAAYLKIAQALKMFSAFPLAANFYEEAIYRSIILFPPLFYSVWKPTMSELDTQLFNLPSFARRIVLASCQFVYQLRKLSPGSFSKCYLPFSIMEG